MDSSSSLSVPFNSSGQSGTGNPSAHSSANQLPVPNCPDTVPFNLSGRIKRYQTHQARQVMVGGVAMGGGAPVVVQSMLNCAANDAAANLAQIARLAEAGCEVVRMAIPSKQALPTFEEVCAKSPLPVVADIHFSADLAIEAARRGAAKLRINPGNIGGLEATAPVLAAAKECAIPIRIGVNAGSLDDKIAANDQLTLPQKLVASAAQYKDFCQQEGFYDLVISAKAHDVPTTLATYRALAAEMPEVPLHIGVTEAGTFAQGLVKSACGLGILLEQGIGDTLRISLTDDPVKEVIAAWHLLGALDLRRRGPEIISCPTCGRCAVNLIELATSVEERLRASRCDKPISVAVMGCVVNGPGEAKGADIGVACGDGTGIIFVKGETVAKVPEDALGDALLKEIAKL